VDAVDSRGGRLPPSRNATADHHSLGGGGQAAHDPASILDGEWRDADGQRFLVIDRRYAPGYRHGRCAVVDSAPDGDDCWPSLAMLEPPLASGRLLFLDLETTGLAGGAGTYAFLVGCGWFERGGFRVRQYLLTGFGAERALLQDVAQFVSEAGGLGTYNGKTFDLPLMETRFLLHRMGVTFAGMPHVDMLHPARRLWKDAGSAERWSESSAEPGPRTDIGSCRLTTLERTLLGHVREGDVPGFEIPGRYFHFVRTGDARPLAGVLEHNRLDILSLALVTARLAHLLAEGAAAAGTGREALGLGRMFERAGMTGAASSCYDAAVMLGEDSETIGEALRAAAIVLRRARRYEEAAGTWRRILDLRPCPPVLAREAVEALAVHHEHRARELDTARRFALESLSLTTNDSRMQAARHRLARLDRKLGVSAPRTEPPDLAPLF
jgi:uncharacterized protein YprB with RNaseH-like and TPR domain